MQLELCHIFFLESDSLEGQQLKSSCYKVGRWLSAKSSQLDFGFFMAKLSNWNSSFSLLPRKHESLIWSQQELWDLLFVMACRVIDIVLCYISFLLLVFAFSSYFHQRANNTEYTNMDFFEIRWTTKTWHQTESKIWINHLLWNPSRAFSCLLQLRFAKKIT